MRAFAHSVPELDIEKWEALSAHLSAVGDHAAELAAAFGWGEVARIAGRLHDIGKVSAEFQAYIRGQRPRGGDHSTAGARVAVERYEHPLGRMLALAVAGHHAGLADSGSLEARLQVHHPIPPTPPGKLWPAISRPCRR